MTSQADIKLSKKLSYLLRHGAKRENLTISADGYVLLSEILQKYSEFSCDSIKRIVTNDAKQRYSLEEDVNKTLKIRANQGHSIADVNELNLKLVENPDFSIIHGTSLINWKSIKCNGLSRMQRNHIHFAKDLSTECGLRKSAEVLIYIDYKRAAEDGLKFYESDNGVILSPGNETGVINHKYFLTVLSRDNESIAFMK